MNTLTRRIMIGMGAGLVLGLVLNQLGTGSAAQGWIVQGVLDTGGCVARDCVPVRPFCPRERFPLLHVVLRNRGESDESAQGWSRVGDGFWSANAWSPGENAVRPFSASQDAFVSAVLSPSPASAQCLRLEAEAPAPGALGADLALGRCIQDAMSRDTRTGAIELAYPAVLPRIPRVR